ncbi:hypothetical protein PVL29_020583 [Vitis rotundifolia]|uniref:Protein EXORDIUM-like 2 n=1 Tax=Vitis rotundifolia TaxID=103349 RepID=A0AA38YXD9_VITRO|nr:hypothetical protein PVL29_020583 [Vitis rotundifolia]
MASSSPISISFLLLLLLLPSASSDPQPSFHGGLLLTGNVNLSLLWYGNFGRVQKSVIRSFIKSLSSNFNTNLEPPVSSWWQMVESYQSVANDRLVRVPKIRVRVVRQVTDVSYSIGKVVTKDFLSGLVSKATNGDTNTVAVVFTARDVTVHGLCMGKCSYHGVTGPSNQLYIMVGNPETECPGECAWPFHRTDYGPQGVTLQPPNGNVGADAMVISFASALAGLVTNPYNDGFYDGPESDPVEASTICQGIFGSGAFPGYTGKVRVNPTNGGCFNAHGLRGKKFLLPALWDPKTSSCWTTM